MIISVEKAKELIQIPENWTNEKLERKLKAIEQTIRRYTNNNFQDTAFRVTADIVGGLFGADRIAHFAIGDTVQISETWVNKGLYTIASCDDTTFTVEEDVLEEDAVLVTKIDYPEDVVDCALNLLEWDINHRDKIGVKSETLSRHSVTYEDSASMFNGYPKGILNAVDLYKKVRF